jgi:glycosyltransferase domain-containing protein
MHKGKLITILPYLKGREAFTERYLGLAKFFSYHHHILIIKEKGSRNINIPSELKTISTITQIKIQGMSDVFKAIYSSKGQIINFEYCHFVEDDNFVFSSSLNYLLNNLQESPEYSGVVGNSFLYDKDDYNILNNYRMSAFTHKTPLQRLEYYGSDSRLTYYSIFRSKEFLSICSEVVKVSDHNMSELAFNLLVSLRCKIKFYNVLFLAREYPRPLVYNVPKRFDWLINEKFSNELKNLLCILKDEIRLSANLNKNQEIFDLTLSNYFSSTFVNKKIKFIDKAVNLIMKWSFINNKEVRKMLKYLKYNGA